MFGMGHGADFFDTVALQEIQEWIAYLKDQRVKSKIILEAPDDEYIVKQGVNYMVNGEKYVDTDMISQIISRYYKEIYHKPSEKSKLSTIIFQPIDFRDNIPFLNGLGDIIFYFDAMKETPPDFTDIIDSLMRNVTIPSDAVGIIQDLILNYMKSYKSASDSLSVFKKLNKSQIRYLDRYADYFKQGLDENYAKSFIKLRSLYTKRGTAIFNHPAQRTGFKQICRLLHNYSMDLIGQIFILQGLTEHRKVIVVIAGLSHVENLDDFMQSIKKQQTGNN